MKRTIGLAIILAAVGILWFIAHRSGTTSVSTQGGTTSTAAIGHPNPSNATFTFDDGPITLKDGEALVPIAPKSQITNTITLTDTIAYGDLNGDGKEDAAVLLAQTNGISGSSAILLGAYVSGPISYKGSNVVSVGDRIVPKSIFVKGKTVTVTYLDRKPDEPLDAEPTVLRTQEFTYSTVTHSLDAN